MRPFIVHGCHGNSEIHMRTKLPCIVWCASLRSEEVVIGKSARGHFLFIAVMEIHMCTKFHLHAHYSSQV